jgi:hypothetical protein
MGRSPEAPAHPLSRAYEGLSPTRVAHYLFGHQGRSGNIAQMLKPAGVAPPTAVVPTAAAPPVVAATAGTGKPSTEMSTIEARVILMAVAFS